MTVDAGGGARAARPLTTGERLRQHREARGMSRPVLAGLAGRSSDWLKKIENGDRQLNSLPMLVRLSRILDLSDVSELVGAELPAPVEAWNSELHHVIPEVRAAMKEVSFGSLGGDPHLPIISASELTRTVRELWTKWHTSSMQRSVVGRALPHLIRQAHAAIRHFDGEERRACKAASGDLYRLTQRLLAHICEPELHVLAVERGRALSEEADNPSSLANAAWASSVALCASGEYHYAATLADRAVTTLLKSSPDGPAREDAGVIGALQLECAAAYGLAGREGDAFHYLDAAASTAEKLPPGLWHLPSAFNYTNVEILSIIVNASLHKSGEAIAQMRKIDLTKSPSVVRQSRAYLEIALAHHNRREHPAAVRSLQAAVKISPEAVALIPWARDLADVLVEETTSETKADAVAVSGHMRTVR